MSLTVASTYALNDVIDAVPAGRSFIEGPGSWTLKHLAVAAAHFAGRWRLVDVPPEELRTAVLGAHAGEPCHGDVRELVPACGTTVIGTASRLRAGLAGYQRHNPAGWGRIEAGRLGHAVSIRACICG